MNKISSSSFGRGTRLVALCALLGLLMVSLLFAGPAVTPTKNATALANALIGSGVTLSGTPILTQTGIGNQA